MASTGGVLRGPADKGRGCWRVLESAASSEGCVHTLCCCQPTGTAVRPDSLPSAPCLSAHPQDGTSAPLPPGSTYIDPLTNTLRGPDELVEGLSAPAPEGPSRRGFLQQLFGGGGERVDLPVQRFEVDLSDPRDYEEQMAEQQFLADPDDPTAPLLPEGFDIEALARQVEAEARARGR